MSNYLLSRIPDCECSRAKYLERKDFVLSSAYGMKYSIENALKNPQDTKELILSHDYPLLKREYNELAFAKDYADMPFGIVGTVERAGVLVLSAHNAFYALPSTDFYQGCECIPSVEKLNKDATTKGYRMWCCENFPYISFGWTEIKVKEIKKVFLNNSRFLKEATPEVISSLKNAKTPEDIIKVLGRPHGIGGSMYYLDELIANFAVRGIHDVHPIAYRDTRLHNIHEIFENLWKETGVIVRVQNSIYLDDPEKVEGRYVILIGFEGTTAVLLDSSIKGGIFKCPAERLFKAMIANVGLIGVFDLSSLTIARII